MKLNVFYMIVKHETAFVSEQMLPKYQGCLNKPSEKGSKSVSFALTPAPHEQVKDVSKTISGSFRKWALSPKCDVKNGHKPLKLKV